MTPVRVAILASVFALAACRENPLISEPNDRPVAVARVVLDTGPADATTFPDKKQEALQFAFDGAPIDIKLDGLGSTDKDGKILKYEWQSGTPIGDAGAPDSKETLWMPEGSTAGWPGNEPMPTVRITEAGVYSFNLWVTDDAGSTSVPDSIKFTVGSAVDPAVTMCIASVHMSVTPECAQCMCSKGDTCIAAVAETACNGDCWSLIRCIGTMCPDFMPGGDTSCVVAMCGAFTGAAAMAGPAGMCIRMCLDVCSSAPPAAMP